MGENSKAAKKNVAKDAAAAAAFDLANWRYNPFIPLIFIPMLVALVVYLDASVVFLERAYIIKYHDEINTACH